MTSRRGWLKRYFSGGLLDQRFAANWGKYVYQSFLVTLTIAVVVSVLDTFYQTVLIAALGASAFVAFSVPSLRASRPRCLIGGYVVGIAVGTAVSLFTAKMSSVVPMPDHFEMLFMGAVSAGLAMFIMVVTNTEHPPGAALAIGFVYNEWTFMTVVIVLVGIIAISLVKESLRGRLIDLL